MLNAGFMPERIVAGETIWISALNTTQATNYDLKFTNYLPASYALSYKFAATTPITVAGVTNGSTGWTLEVTAAQTTLWKPGEISFAGYVTHSTSGRVFAVDAGAIAVTASPSATSDWTAVVTACDAAIATYAANPHGSISMGGMSVSFRSFDQLVELRAYAKSMELYETGNRPKRIIRTRFT